MKRQKLRKKETKRILKELEETSGVRLEGELERVDVAGRTVLLLDGEPVILEHDGRYYLTVYGIMKHRPEKGQVIVDEGAVKFVMNGADVMRPGIIEADPSIREGDFCYVVVEKKLTPLAVGKALTDGNDMIGERGKVVENIHHLNDKIWKFFFKRNQ